MKLSRYILIFFVFLSLRPFAQKEANIWYFGRHAGLDFNSNPPTVLTNGAMDQLEGSSSICNSSGQLLFYTDGITVWDKNSNPMPNGSGLMGNAHSTNSGFILHKPGNSNIYYIFTTQYAYEAGDLRYSIVDMTLNSGLGDVTMKNVLIKTDMKETLCAIKHSNNNDIWLIAHERSNNIFNVFLITSSGFSTTPIDISIGQSASGPQGYMKFSPCGDKIANSDYLNHTVEVFDFNKSTGVISAPQLINFSDRTEGIEFSNNQKYLYVAVGYTSFNLFQVDLQTYVKIVVGSPAAVAFGNVQLGPDGKIYLCQASSPSYNPYDYVGVINYPELQGVACNYVKNAVYLNLNGNTQSRFGLPNFVADYYKFQFKLRRDTSICFGDSIKLSAGSGYLSYLWSTGSSDSVIYVNQAGDYWCSVTSICGPMADTVNILHKPTPNINLGTDTSFCGPFSITLHAGGGFESYHWQNNSTDSIFSASLAGSYSVTVTNQGCSDKDTIIISQQNNPNVNIGTDTSICTGSSFTLNAGGGFDSYQWQNGSTDSTFLVLSSGTYSVTVYNNGCSGVDSVIISQELSPHVNLGPDTSICAGNSITFHAGGGFNSYHWQNGSTDSVFNASASGWCSVTVTNQCGSDVDSVRIINIYPKPQPDLGNDTVICTSSPITLDAGSGYTSYQWQNSSIGQTLIVNSPGTYSVTVTNSHNCQGADTIIISQGQQPDITLGENRDLCKVQSIVLDPGSGYLSYKWQDGSTGQTFTVTKAGTYSVTVTDDCGSERASVTISDCPECICEIPNAFTPNYDDQNDYLMVRGKGFTDLEFKVYNRLGEQVFVSHNIDYGWDGKWLGVMQKSDVYVYVITAVCESGKKIFKKGNVTLLR